MTLTCWRPAKLDLALIFLHVVLTIWVSFSFSGSFHWLAFFSLNFCILAILVSRARQYLSVFFLGCMLWLGFWLKFIFHQIVTYPFVEFTGRFTNLPEQWDKVLIISSVGALGFNLAVGIFGKFNPKPNLELVNFEKLQGSKSLLWLFLGLSSLILLTAFLNFSLGLTLSGIVAITSLPFKLNAISGWFLYMGFTLLICIFANYEFKKTSKLTYSVSLAFLESFVCSVSLLSRGHYIFHLISFAYIILLNYRPLKIRWIHVFGFTAVFGLLFISNTLVVNALRYQFYGINKLVTKVLDPMPDVVPQIESNSTKHIFPQSTAEVSSDENEPLKYNPSILLEAKTYRNRSEYSFVQFNKLLLDRWIGLEGVMAISTYPEKGYSLFVTTLLNKLKPGEQDIYAQISLSSYALSTKYTFTGLPGIMAFLYYTESLLIVGLGMFLIMGIFLKIDLWLFQTFKNPFLSTQVGFYLALSISQFGISPRPLFISWFMTASFLTGIMMASKLQSFWMNKGYR